MSAILHSQFPKANQLPLIKQNRNANYDFAGTNEQLFKMFTYITAIIITHTGCDVTNDVTAH